MNKLIIISGPTASGKTKTSIELAKKIESSLKIKCLIINFDSLLFYKEISIGTAKPTLTERQGIEHAMIDIESIANPMNASNYIDKAQTIIQNCMLQNICPILVGGSAFYLRALLKGMYETGEASMEATSDVENLYKEQGIGPILDYLKLNDPEALNFLHINDHYRLMRAAIHHKSSNQKISDQKKISDQNNPYDFELNKHHWKILHIYLDLPKEEHYEIIKKRTQLMFEEGLLEEIEKLSSLGFQLDEKPLASIGYKEAIELRKGLFRSTEECIERISISTRQLAKSQRTFFKKITPKLLFNPHSDQDKIFSSVELFLT
jgi:tRNA dimethylallyltransferase